MVVPVGGSACLCVNCSAPCCVALQCSLSERTCLDRVRPTTDTGTAVENWFLFVVVRWPECRTRPELTSDPLATGDTQRPQHNCLLIRLSRIAAARSSREAQLVPSIHFLVRQAARERLSAVRTLSEEARARHEAMAELYTRRAEELRAGKGHFETPGERDTH